MLRQFCSVKLKSSKLMVCLSLITIFILIVATVTIVTIISKTPIIILALGQAQAGHIDLSISTIGSSTLNNTQIRSLTQQDSMPRINVDGIRINEIYGTGWLMDFEAENRNHLGHFGFDIPGNQVFLHDSYGIPKGQIVQVEIPAFGVSIGSIVQLLQKAGVPDNMTEEDFNKTVGILQSMWRLTGTFQVAGTFSTSEGKFRQGETAYYAYFNINTVLQYIAMQQLRNQLNVSQSILSCAQQLLSPIRLSDFSDRVIFNMPNRTEVYGEVNFDVVSQQVSSFSTDIVEKLGVYAIQPSQPILYLLFRMNYFGMFIGVILKLIVFSLFCLSVLMMYNMMMIGVESKNFDFGMLRTVGMNRKSLMLAVLVDSLKYVVVANLMGFPVSYGTLKIVSSIFTKFFGFDYVLVPTFDAVAIAAVVGFLVPMVASFVPIRVALGEKIIESINPVRNKTVAIKHQTYIEGRQFPLSRFLFGLLSCSIGFMIFYLLPQSLVDQNVGLLLIIFFTLLIGLLLGLVILTYSFQYVLERGVAYLTLFWLKAADLSLVIKNLSAHREKNRRAALLYSLSVSFIVFVSVGISIQIQTIYNELLKQHSCYLEINNQNYRGVDRSFYDELFNNPEFKPVIKDYSYVTYSLQNYLNRFERVQSIQASDKARQFFLNNDIYGVSPNFLKTLYFQNFEVSQTVSTNGLDPIEYLYTEQGQNTCIVSSYLAEKLNIDVQGNNQFLLTLNWPTSSHRFVKNVSSVFAKGAGLPFSSFMFLPSSIVVPFEGFAELANLPSLKYVPIQKYSFNQNRIKIELFNSKNSSVVANKLRREMAKGGQSDSVWDYAELTTTINDIESLLTKIFLILLAVVLIISFFSLLTTASTNILNQTKEISILLGLGLSKNRITGIYIYEAFALVLTACLIGIFVGAVLAVLMGMQRQLFGDFPVEVNISGVWIIVGTAVLSAVASTLGTIRRVLNHRVAQILKMT